MSFNDGAYGQEVEEYSMDLALNDIGHFEIENRIWMRKSLGFNQIDFQKHSKKNHFIGRTA